MDETSSSTLIKRECSPQNRSSLKSNQSFRKRTTLECASPSSESSASGPTQATHARSNIVNHVSHPPRRLSRCLPYCLLPAVLLYVTIPLLYFLFPWIVVKVVFLNNLCIPFTDYTDPTLFGLNGTRNFYLQSEQNVQLGVWHILPESLVKESAHHDGYYEDSLSTGLPVFLYLHGNAFSRVARHRVSLYKVLQKANFHVIAMDYRGFGDSTGSPTEDGVVHDSKVIFKWIKAKSKSSPVFILGHSLGTGIGTRATAELCDESVPPDGLILEAPFNNIVDAAKLHIFAKPMLTLYPYAENFIFDNLHKQSVFFDSEKHIHHVSIPILILHAEDDKIVPFKLGLKLYEASKSSSKKSRPVKFVRYDASLKYNHNEIHRDPGLPETIRNFVQSSLK